MRTMDDEYPKEDKCRYCGEHIGWMLNPIAEGLALGLCDKPECRYKAENENLEGPTDVSN
jgi:hypothetical protein